MHPCCNLNLLLINLLINRCCAIATSISLTKLRSQNIRHQLQITYQMVRVLYQRDHWKLKSPQNN